MRNIPQIAGSNFASTSLVVAMTKLSRGVTLGQGMQD
jgi:hypothetical protein